MGILIAMQIPIGSKSSFRGIIDLLTEKAVIWEDDLGKEPIETEIPFDLKPQLQAFRALMVEKIAETDDKLTIKYLEGGVISDSELKAALRSAVIRGAVAPVYCGSSLRNKGVQPILDAVIDYLPSPEDVPPVKGLHPKTDEEIERPPSDQAPLSALGVQNCD